MSDGTPSWLDTAWFSPEKPWSASPKDHCFFHHSMVFPDGEIVDGEWDIRDFDQYVGPVDVAGKTLLDVGTASGYIAFRAEARGARVTAIDLRHGSERQVLQFAGSLQHTNRRRFNVEREDFSNRLKNGFWYSFHKFGSGVEVIYVPLRAIPYWDRTFDIVVAGAIIEHLADPVTFICNIARICRETLILPFTHVLDDEAQVMVTANQWSDPTKPGTHWTMSTGLLKRILSNVGFQVRTVPSRAFFQGHRHDRVTLIATRENFGAQPSIEDHEIPSQLNQLPARTPKNLLRFLTKRPLV